MRKRRRQRIMMKTWLSTGKIAMSKRKLVSHEMNWSVRHQVMPGVERREGK